MNSPKRKPASRGSKSGSGFTLHLARFFMGANIISVALLWLSAASVYVSPTSVPFASVMGLAFPIFLVVSTLFVPFWLVFSWRRVWLPLAGLLACSGSILAYCPVSLPSVPPKSAIKVLSYNTLGFGEGKANDEGENLVINYVIESEADIFCYQEGLNADNKAWFNKNIKRLTRMPHSDVHLISSLNVLGISSRYPIVGKEVIVERGGNGSIAFKLLINEGRDTIIVINSHLESNHLSTHDRASYQGIVTGGRDEGDVKAESRRLIGKLSAAAAVRAEQADSVAAYIARQHLPIISCGDFNDTPISYTRRVMKKNMKDAYARRGNGPGYSYNRSAILVRIDHMLYSPRWDVYDCRIDHSTHLSDHYPISAYFKLKP